MNIGQIHWDQDQFLEAEAKSVTCAGRRSSQKIEVATGVLKIFE